MKQQNSTLQEVLNTLISILILLLSSFLLQKAGTASSKKRHQEVMLLFFYIQTRKSPQTIWLNPKTNLSISHSKEQRRKQP
jgi:hypothetical protein